MATSSVWMSTARRSPRRARVENVSTGPDGLRRTGMKVARSAITDSTRRPVTKLVRSSQCEPMSPTARSVAAAIRLEAPVPIGVVQQPVLEVAAGDQADVAEPAAADELGQVLVERVEADVEVDRVDEA